MTKRTTKAKPYIAPTMAVQVNAIVDIDDEINTWFNAGLADYCQRFKVQVMPERLESKIKLSLIYAPAGDNGLCAYEPRPQCADVRPNIMIQARCIALSDEGYSSYSVTMFLEVLAHEFVHAYQALTGRKGLSTEYIETHCTGEDYYFDPEEQEARLLQAFYAHSIAKDTVIKMMSKYENAVIEEVTL